MDEQEPEQLNSAIAKARKIRGSLIDLGYEIPEGAPKAVLNAWSTADRGLYELISALEEDRASARVDVLPLPGGGMTPSRRISPKP